MVFFKAGRSMVMAHTQIMGYHPGDSIPESLAEIVSGSRARFFAKSKALQDFVLTGILSFQSMPYRLAEVEETIGTSWRQGKA